MRAAAALCVMVLTLLCLPAYVLSDDLQRGREYNRNGSEWDVSLGVMGLYKPEYEGSDEYEFTGLPSVDIRYGEKYFLNARKGLGMQILDRDGWKLGISAGYRFGRDQDDSDDLKGLGDVDGGVTANFFAEWRTGDVSVKTRFEHQFTGDSTGFLVDLGAGYTLRRGSNLSIIPSVMATYASTDYMELFFGVSKRQSRRSGLPVYDADAGIKSVGPRLLLLYRLDRNWALQCSAAYDRLTSDAEDSPVVQDRDQFRANVGISYRF